MFKRPLQDITKDDIVRLIGRYEDERFEAKEILTGDERIDTGEAPKFASRIYNGGALEEKSRDAIAKEICAFANRDGGTLVIGLEEADGNCIKGLADLLVPNPDTVADNLSRAVQAVIEPPLSGLRIRGLADPDRSDGHGYLVLQVEPSGLAPHRLKSKKEKDAYIRRGEESVSMSMREIQDLTLLVERRRAGRDEIFEARRSAFLRQQVSTSEAATAKPGYVAGRTLQSDPRPSITGVRDLLISAKEPRVVVRATVVALQPMSRRFALQSVQQHFLYRSGTTGKHYGRDVRKIHQGAMNWRGTSNGFYSRYSTDSADCWDIVSWDGFADCWFFLQCNTETNPTVLPLGWAREVVVRALYHATFLRFVSGSFDAPFELEVELHRPEGAIMADTYGSFIELFDHSLDRSCVLGRYTVGPSDAPNDLVTLIAKEIVQSQGLDSRTEHIEYLLAEYQTELATRLPHQNAQ